MTTLSGEMQICLSQPPEEAMQDFHGQPEGSLFSHLCPFMKVSFLAPITDRLTLLLRVFCFFQNQAFLKGRKWVGTEETQRATLEEKM